MTSHYCANSPLLCGNGLWIIHYFLIMDFWIQLSIWLCTRASRFGAWRFPNFSLPWKTSLTRVGVEPTAACLSSERSATELHHLDEKPRVKVWQNCAMNTDKCRVLGVSVKYIQKGCSCKAKFFHALKHCSNNPGYISTTYGISCVGYVITQNYLRYFSNIQCIQPNWYVIQELQRFVRFS